MKFAITQVGCRVLNVLFLPETAKNSVHLMSSHPDNTNQNTNILVSPENDKNIGY